MMELVVGGLRLGIPGPRLNLIVRSLLSTVAHLHQRISLATPGLLSFGSLVFLGSSQRWRSPSTLLPKDFAPDHD